MGKYTRRNETAIRRGFRRLSYNKDMAIEAGMKEMMDNAMLFALGEHDENHWFHKSTENSYGWAVIHDGVGVANKVNEGRHGGGDALEQLMEASREAPQKGWIGILLASFRVGNDKPTPRMFLFELDYEMSLLYETRDMTREQFNRYFKPIR